MSRSCSTLPPLPNSPGVINSRNDKKNENVKKSMEITIHVCDEAKNLKKDFTCPKSQLLEEMKYFQDYLSSNNETWEDIDISVHCDVKIFDWLIRYVKRDKENPESGPILSAKSAVSILISSEFLKMEKLVDKCIEFCHDHMSEVIASPCNMNCINDHLVKRIASKFTQHDLESVIDKKDKFKSKLFCKKIEEMFDPSFSCIYSPYNASNLFMCLYCQKLLLPSVEKEIKCIASRTLIDQHGNLHYVHLKDESWDIQEYLSNLKSQYKTWRCVFWKLWSDVNYLQCDECDEVFSLSWYNYCKYHPEEAVQSETGGSLYTYPCCGKEMFLFEPVSSKSGCKYRQHQVSVNDPKNVSNRPWLISSKEVYQELLQVAPVICEDASPAQDQTEFTLELMMKTELSRLNKNISVTSSKDVKQDKKRPSSKHHHVPASKNRNKTGFPVRKTGVGKHDPMDEEDEDGTSDLDELGIVRIVIQHNDSPTRVNSTAAKTWNNDLPTRLNQDLQRESDVKRMNELIQKLSLSSNNQQPPSIHNTQQPGMKDRSYLDGGLYCPIEYKVKTLLQQQVNLHVATSSSNVSNKNSKNR